MRRIRTRCGPLHVALIRPAPHRDLAIAIGLLRQPFDDVVAVVRHVSIEPELAFGVRASTHVDGEERKTTSRKIDATLMEALGDIRRQNEYAGCRGNLPLRQ